MNKFLNEKWMSRYLKLTKDIANWSKDPNKKIGALIVNKKGNIVSQGYNGFPRGIKDNKRYNDKITKNKFVVHAEVNAILNALYNGASVKNCSIFISGLPVCHDCAKVIIQSGIKNVIIDTKLKVESSWYQSNLDAIDMFNEAHINCYLFDKNIFKMINYNHQIYYIKE